MEEPVEEGLRRLMLENPNIRVVPSMEQLVSESTGFDFELRGSEVEFARRLHSSTRDRSFRREDLFYVFATSDNPYASVLRLIVKTAFGNDFRPKTAPYVMLECLDSWALQENPAKITSLLTPELKIVAFNIAIEQKHPAFAKLAVTVYHMEENNVQMLPFIRNLMSKSNYKTACHCLIMLQLQDSIEIEELLLPLVLQDKLCLINEYLNSCPHQAIKLVKYIDDLIESKSIIARVQDYLIDNIVSDIKWDKLHHRPLGKLAIRLCKRFDIPLEICENLSQKRAFGGIKYLIRQKYQEKVISDNVWNDLVIDTITNNPTILKELVDLLTLYDTKEALKWAKHFNLPQDMYPPNIYDDTPDYLNNTVNYDDEENCDMKPGPSQIIQFHKLPSHVPMYVFVDSIEVFENEVRNQFSDYVIVGLDSEWKPSFGTKPSSVSLIQIATPNRVFIFDVMTLSKIPYANIWSYLIDQVFHNINIIKIGFAIDNDMREITSSVPGFECVKFRGLGYLELSQLWRNCLNSGVKMPYQKLNSGEGLNSIVEQCFGVPLDKSEQCSNWENRPLRESQLEYAALDAYVLLEIYELLSSLCQEYNVDFEKICYRIMSNSNIKHKKSGRRSTKKNN